MLQVARTVLEIAAAISGRGKAGRSAAYRWLWDRYPQLSAISKAGRSDWVSVTEELQKLGITGRAGKPLKPDNVRKTWQRVVADVERHGYREPPPMPIRKKSPPRPKLPEEMAPADFSSEPEQPKRKFRRGATFRGTEE